MILTDEDFYCPVHGRLPQGDGEASQYDEHGEGPYFPYARAWHRGCGAAGEWVCAGNCAGCRLAGDFCVSHGNYVGVEPHPFSMAASHARQLQMVRAEGERDRELAVEHDPEDPPPPPPSP